MLISSLKYPESILSMIYGNLRHNHTRFKYTGHKSKKSNLQFTFPTPVAPKQICHQTWCELLDPKQSTNIYSLKDLT